MKSELAPSPSGEEIESSQDVKKNGTSRHDFLKFMGKATLGATAAVGAFKKFEKVAEALEVDKKLEMHWRDWQKLKRAVNENGVRANSDRVV